MTHELMTRDWYTHLVDECKAIVTETVFNSRLELIRGKHALGERICTDDNFNKAQGSQDAKLQQIFNDIGLNKSDGYYCVQFYEKFPSLSTAMEKFEEQKNISWTKIKQKYLPATPPVDNPPKEVYDWRKEFDDKFFVILTTGDMPVHLYHDIIAFIREALKKKEVS